MAGQRKICDLIFQHMKTESLRGTLWKITTNKLYCGSSIRFCVNPWGLLWSKDALNLRLKEWLRI